MICGVLNPKWMVKCIRLGNSIPKRGEVFPSGYLQLRSDDTGELILLFLKDELICDLDTRNLTLGGHRRGWRGNNTDFL